ncbi:hypothetical protein Tco_0187225, partial [Tanacetum coccineum]
ERPLLAGPDVHGQSLAALPSQSAASENGSQIPGAVSECEYSEAGAESDESEGESRVHTRDHGGSE